jgi:hypothetical protein
MADYYPIVAKAVNALGSNNEEARRRVYDRARAALLSEVHKLVPALDQSEIMAEQLYLELAIGEVEADTQREQSDQSAVAAPFTAFPCGGVVAAPNQPANQNDEESYGARMRAYGQDFRRFGKGAKARSQRPNGQPAGESDCLRVRDTWLTELLARASREVDNEEPDFTPKRALRYAG